MPWRSHGVALPCDAIDVYWLIGLAVADALLATWAANDRLKSR